MVLVKCDGCQTRPDEKLISVTWSWRRADNVRVAYRSRLCSADFMAKVSPLNQSYVGVERLTCPGCGIDTEDDMDAIYTTSYIGGYGEFKTESPFCNACAAQLRIWVQEHSRQLQDPLGATGGPQQDISAAETLRSLGIELRP